MLDRVASIVLIVFGLLALIVLTIGLAISCRQQPPDPTDATASAIAQTPGAGTPISGTASSTPIAGGTMPGGTVDPGATVPGGTVPPGSSATPIGGATPAVPTFVVVTPGSPTPTLAPGATASATPGPSPTGGATAAPTATGPAATATLPPGGLTPGATVRHVVGRGDWLLQIARCYGASYPAVRAANWLPNPDMIMPGAIITVPNIGSEGRIIGPPCVQSYTVLAGDTWESLAARYGTTAAILQRANPGALSVGRQIWVPRV